MRRQTLWNSRTRAVHAFRHVTCVRVRVAAPPPDRSSGPAASLGHLILPADTVTVPLQVFPIWSHHDHDDWHVELEQLVVASAAVRRSTRVQPRFRLRSKCWSEDDRFASWLATVEVRTRFANCGPSLWPWQSLVQLVLPNVFRWVCIVENLRKIPPVVTLPCRVQGSISSLPLEKRRRLRCHVGRDLGSGVRYRPSFRNRHRLQLVLDHLASPTRRLLLDYLQSASAAFKQTAPWLWSWSICKSVLATLRDSGTFRFSDVAVLRGSIRVVVFLGGTNAFFVLGLWFEETGRIVRGSVCYWYSRW